MKKLLTLSIIAILILASCETGTTVYRKIKTISDSYIWTAKDTIFFKKDIKDSTSNMQLSVSLRYIMGYPNTTLPIKLVIIDPKGNVLELTPELNIVDENNKYIGDIMGDLADIEQVVVDSVIFSSPGVYNFKLIQNANKPVVSHVHAIGLCIKKIK